VGFVRFFASVSLRPDHLPPIIQLKNPNIAGSFSLSLGTTTGHNQASVPGFYHVGSPLKIALSQVRSPKLFAPAVEAHHPDITFSCSIGVGITSNGVVTVAILDSGGGMLIGRPSKSALKSLGSKGGTKQASPE
jgi:hypothetical protein